MENYKPIPKPLGYRIQELLQSLQVIRDSLGAVRQGRLHQFIPLYGQLRALLSEKRKGNQPLLLTIAKEIGMQLKIYGMQGVDDDKALPPELKKNLLLHLSGFPVSLYQELPGQRLITIEDFLDQKILTYGQKRYTPKDVITFFANKAGGAHFSPDMDQDFAQLLSFGLFGQPMLLTALGQIGEITYNLGLKLLKSLTEFEAHLSLFIPNQSVQQPAYIFDKQHPNSPMRIFFRLDPGMSPHFGITDIQGITVTAGVNRIIEYSKPHYFLLSNSINNQLHTKLNIFIDGEEMGEAVVERPLFIMNDPFYYMCYTNRSKDNEATGLEIGFIEMAMYNKELSLKKRAEVLFHFEEVLSGKELICRYFRKGQYGYSAPGAKDLELLNGPVTWSVSKLIAGEYPPNKGNSTVHI